MERRCFTVATLYHHLQSIMHSSLVDEMSQDIALHASDFVPLGAQAQLLRVEVEDQQTAIRTLHSQTSSSSSELRSEKLCALRLTLSSSSEIKKALLAPVRKLPPEILSEVFAWCIPDFIDASAIRNSSAPELAPLLLVRVCKRWQRVAVGTPRLWTKLGLQGVGGINPLVLISTWLRRSGSLPIDIYINPLSWKYPIRTDHFKNIIIPKAVQLLAADFHRCRTFHSSNFPALLEGLFPDGSHRSAPLLRDLQITPSPKSSGYTLVGNITAPNLEIIDICDPRQSLSSITLNKQNLRNVRWNGSSVSNSEDSSLDHLADFLRSCPNLQECEIVRPTQPTDFISRTMISLPRLRRLSLIWKWTVELEDFLSLLDFPALEFLRLEIDQTRTRPTLKRTLDALFPSSKPSPLLKELHIVHLDIIMYGDTPNPNQAFVPPLVFPNLESLHFEDCTLHSAFLEELTPQPDQPHESWKLPKLSSLHLSRVNLDGPCFVRMVRSRLLNAVAQHSHFTLVSLVDCRGLSHAESAGLRALVDMHEDFRVSGLGPS